MAKAYRGNNVKEHGWRGTCPVCQRTGVKVLWTKTDDNGNELKVCKACSK